MMGGKEVGSVRELGSIASCHIHAVISKIDKSIKSIVAQRNSYRIPSGEGGGRWGGAHEGGGGGPVLKQQSSQHNLSFQPWAGFLDKGKHVNKGKRAVGRGVKRMSTRKQSQSSGKRPPCASKTLLVCSRP